jgi:hypothetical protein
LGKVEMAKKTILEFYSKNVGSRKREDAIMYTECVQHYSDSVYSHAFTELVEENKIMSTGHAFYEIVRPGDLTYPVKKILLKAAKELEVYMKTVDPFNLKAEDIDTLDTIKEVKNTLYRLESSL